MKGLRIPTNMKNKPPSWLILECRYSQVPVLSSAPILPHRLLSHPTQLILGNVSTIPPILSALTDSGSPLPQLAISLPASNLSTQ